MKKESEGGTVSKMFLPHAYTRNPSSQEGQQTEGLTGGVGRRSGNPESVKHPPLSSRGSRLGPLARNLNHRNHRTSKTFVFFLLFYFRWRDEFQDTMTILCPGTFDWTDESHLHSLGQLIR